MNSGHSTGTPGSGRLPAVGIPGKGHPAGGETWKETLCRGCLKPDEGVLCDPRMLSDDISE